MSPTKLSKKRQWEEARTKFKHDRQLILVGNADDDDFVECTKNGKAESQVLLKYKKQKDTDIMNKKQAGSGSDGQCKTKVHNDYPIISCRTSPYCLLKTIAKLTERQKAAIREMGFSHVLDIKILEIPTKLGHWVVKSFEPRSCELILSNKKRIPIVEEDVYRVFGFPRGKRLISRTTKQDASNMLQEWSKFFDKQKLTTLSPKDVAEVMLKSEDAGTWFKSHFLVLLTACLIENSKTGYIFPHTIDCLGDIERVKEWNWCEYVLRCLITSKLTWEEDTNKAFIGPTLFLLVFNVDRVKILNKTVARDFPLVVNWDYKELKLRQAS